MSEPRWLDHTADVGAELEADDLGALFRAALDALVSVMLATPPHVPDGERTLQLEAPTREHLMVRWLEEWIFLVQSARRVPVDAELSIVGPDHDRGAAGDAPGGDVPSAGRESRTWRLEARVRDATLDPVAHGWQGEVKGATYHGLEIERDGDRWRATIVFDV